MILMFVIISRTCIFIIDNTVNQNIILVYKLYNTILVLVYKLYYTNWEGTKETIKYDIIVWDKSTPWLTVLSSMHIKMHRID